MNKRHLHTRPINIRRVLSLCIVILCICAALTTFSTVKLQSKSSDTVRQYADVFVSKLSNELGNNNSYMENTILTSNYRNMYYQGDMNWIEQTGNLQKTYQLLNQLSINNYNYFIYNTRLNKFLEVTTVTLLFSEYRQIRNEIKTLAAGNVVSGRYELHEMSNGRRVILSMWAYGEFVCGSWITEDDLLAGLDHLGGSNIAQFSLLSVDAASEADRKYVTYELEGVNADFCIQMQIDSDPDMTWILVLQIAQLVLLMIGMTTLSISVAAVHRNLLDPIRNLAGILGKYKKKTTSYNAVNEAFSDTLDDTYTVLSELGEELETLSVRLYEAELEKRQLNINFRNLQIRPHFLVNNLATIHDMAQLNETEKIMNLTVVLSNYYRYVLRDCMDMVPLWHELRHMDNIIKVHREWNGNRVRVEYQVEEAVKSTMIPVLLISTFLENSLKHAANSEGGLNITVCGEPRNQGEKRFLFLRIRDDGGGFPQEMLDALSRGQLIPETDGRHIGINNAIQRIRLIYGDTAKIFLSNHLGGAQVEIWIPMGGEQSEASDRR